MSSHEGRRCDWCGDFIDPIDWCSLCQETESKTQRPCAAVGGPHRSFRKRASQRYCNRECVAADRADLADIRRCYP